MKRAIFFLLCVLPLNVAVAEPDFHSVAPTPPMGWNSWDSFGATINEEQVLDNAQVIARILKPHGWDTVTIDV